MQAASSRKGIHHIGTVSSYELSSRIDVIVRNVPNGPQTPLDLPERPYLLVARALGRMSDLEEAAPQSRSRVPGRARGAARASLLQELELLESGVRLELIGPLLQRVALR